MRSDNPAKSKAATSRDNVLAVLDKPSQYPTESLHRPKAANHATTGVGGVAELLHELTLRQVTLRRLPGCTDTIEASPAAALTAELKASLRAHKPALLDLLRAESSTCPHCGSSDIGDAARYRWCHGCERPLGSSRHAELERQQEREAMKLTDSRKADATLSGLLSWFGSATEPQDGQPIEFASDVYAGRGRYWQTLSEADREALAEPRPTARCCFCGGRSHHNPSCFATPRQRWGKHAGQRLATIPERYLRFVLRKEVGSLGDRQACLAELQRRNTRYREPGWQRLATAPAEPRRRHHD